MNFLTAAIMACLTALFTLSAFAAEGAPTKKEILRSLNQSNVLKGVQSGVKKDYGMTSCSKFELIEGSTEEPIKARSLCSYQDKWGDESGVLIEVEGTVYDGSSFILHIINLVFAG
jgi:hypothetical protein